MDFSFFSRLIPQRKKRNLFLGICLTETEGACYAFEQTLNDIELVHELPFAYTDGFQTLLDDVDKAVYTTEKSVKFSFKKALFILPSLALGASQKEIHSLYRSALADIMHNLELEAMGYIEMIDCYKSLLAESHSSAYVEMGKDETLLVFNRKTNHWKTLVVKTHLANVLSHLDEFLTKGTTLYLRTLHKSVQTEHIIPAVNQYAVKLCTNEELTVGLIHLLKEQMLAPNQSEERLKEQESSVIITPNESENLEPSEDEMMDNGVSPDESIRVETQQIAVDEKDVPYPNDISTESASNRENTEGEIEGFTVYKDGPDQQETGFIQPPPLAPEPAPTEGYQSTFQSTSYPDEAYVQQMEEKPIVNDVAVESLEDTVDEEEDTNNSSERPVNILHSIKSIGLSILIGLIAFTLSLVAVEFLIHRVTIRVYVPTEIEKVVADLSQIPLSRTVEEKDINLSLPTTGEREVGDRAKGKIIMASFDDKEASFSAGTRLFLDDEPYQLDEDVVLSPASVDTVSGTKTASKKSANASASFIGSEGNIEKNKQFQIDDYPTTLYYALSEEGFTGGTRRTVSVVNEDDIADLEAMIIKKGKEASESVRLNTAEGVVVLDDISSVDISGIQYSADEGEIASQIEAKGSVLAELYTIDRSAIDEYLSNYIKNKKGNNFQYVSEGSTHSFSDVKVSSDERTIALTLQSNAKTFRDIDTNKVKMLVRLKLLPHATQILSEELGIGKVEFSFSPILPLFQLFIPYRTDYIQVEMKPR